MTESDRTPWLRYADAIIKIRREPQVASVDLLQQLLAHIPGPDLLDLRDRALKRRIYVAGPPLRIHGANQIFCLERIRGSIPGVEGLKNECLVYNAYVSRRKESFVKADYTHQPGNRTAFEWQETAEDFASVNWPEELVWDEGRCFLDGTIVKPGDEALPISTFTVMYNATWSDMERQANQRPLCDVRDSYVHTLAAWEPVQAEIRTGYENIRNSPVIRAQFCALCGGSIAEHRCTFCQAIFPKNKTYNNFGTPLPTEAAVAYQKIGIEFLIDPVEARKAAYREWATPGFIPEIPAEFQEYDKQHRSVHL